MVIKLKSVLRAVPWSLVAKAAIIGAVWLYLPFWLFILAALYFYFIPFFRPFKFAAAFLIFLVLAGILPFYWWVAAILAIIYALILGVKDLVFIDRRFAYETLVFFLFFLAFAVYFLNYHFLEGSAVLASVLMTIFGYFLIKNLMDYLKINVSGRLKRTASFLIVFLVAEIIFVLLLLPFDFYPRLALGFLFFVFLVDLVLSYLEAKLTNRKILIDFTIFFAMAVIILASVNWGF
jgi:hypothetical protein